MRRRVFTEDHELFRKSARAFIERECLPNADRWAEQGHVDLEAWRKAGAAGLLGIDVPVEYGGSGAPDIRFNMVLDEEAARAGTGLGFGLQNDIVAPYLVSLGTEEQKQRWLPGVCSGDIITSVAMSEPGAGSDLASIRTNAVLDGEDWVLNGAKTFISSGVLTNFCVVVARTNDAPGHKGFSLLVVEGGMPGFTKGKHLDKIGSRQADTAELFFTDVRVPKANLLGEEGRGFYHLMENLPSERLGIAVAGLASAERAYEITARYCTERTAFGQKIGSFQANRFSLAEMHTELQVARGYLDQCIAAVVDGELTATEAAGAKWWITELQWRITDQCMQLHGGYGYINEYEIATIWRNARVQRLYGGTTEVMKDLIGRSLGF